MGKLKEIYFNAAVEVEGRLISEGFALHNTIGYHKEEYPWSVSHILSGFCVGHFQTRDQAVDYAEWCTKAFQKLEGIRRELDGIGPDWTEEE